MVKEEQYIYWAILGVAMKPISPYLEVLLFSLGMKIIKIVKLYNFP